MQIIRRRIADKNVLELIDRFLNAGIMEKVLFKHTSEGVPQGGIFSPLLANIYLNELDQWWITNYHLTQHKRYKRRLKGLGNYILVRYADDFIVLCNGTRQSAELMNEPATDIPSQRTRLDFVQRKDANHARRGWVHLSGVPYPDLLEGRHRTLLVRPSSRNIQRLKDKVKEMTTRRTHLDSDPLKVHAVNAVLRGWSEYLQACQQLKDIRQTRLLGQPTPHAMAGKEAQARHNERRT